MRFRSQVLPAFFVPCLICLMLGLAGAFVGPAFAIKDQGAYAPLPAPEEETFRFVVMADCRGTDGGIHKDVVVKTLKALKKLDPQPRFSVLIGDLVQGSKTYAIEAAQFKTIEKTLKTYYPESFFYPALGNHEMTNSKGELLFKKTFDRIDAHFLSDYNHTSYYFDVGTSRFHILNTSHPKELHKIAGHQLDFLKANAAGDAVRNFYFLHEPLYPTGPHVGEGLDRFPADRDALESVISGSHEPLIFCGHEHFYSRRHLASAPSVYQITTGSFGAPLHTTYKDKENVDVAPIAKYNYCVVDVTNASVEVRAYDLSGKLLDQVLLQKKDQDQ